VSKSGEKNALRQDYVLFESSIPEHRTVVLMNIPEFQSARIPAVFPSYAGLFLQADKASRGTACVKWAYTLEIRLPAWGQGFACRIPILISAAPPYSKELRQCRDNRSNPELTDPWSIFQYTMSGPKEVETAPTIKSPHNTAGGRTMKVGGVDPIWMGDRGEYAVWLKNAKNLERLKEWCQTPKDDDYPDLVKLFYRPVVNIYAGPASRRSLKKEQSGRLSEQPKPK
jgi:hypothetical protein